MKNRFEQTGLGERICIDINPQLIDSEEAFAEDGLKVPYEAVRNYKVIPRIPELEFYITSLDRIEITGDKLETVDPITVAQELGSDSLEFNGDIVEIADDYVWIK